MDVLSGPREGEEPSKVHAVIFTGSCEPEVTWPVTDRTKTRGKGLLGVNMAFSSHLSPQDLNKRLSLPVDIRLPQEFLQKLQLENPGLPKPLTRMSRRASLVSPRV